MDKKKKITAGFAAHEADKKLKEIIAGFAAHEADRKLKEIIAGFAVPGTVTKVEQTVSGHINDTYRADMDTGESYLLQRINHYVFQDVDGLMKNISWVTGHLIREIIKDGGDPARDALNIIPTREGKNYLIYEGNYYRLARFISGSVSVENRAPTLKEVESAGGAFALFIKRLWNFDAETLTEVIPDFHNTAKRFKDFERALQSAENERRALAKEEIDFVLSKRELAAGLEELIAAGKLSLHVTHNDTKIGNVLFDNEGGALAVIDLDTVMRGSPLYDFGDSIRSVCGTAAEDEKNLGAVAFDKALFAAFARGYLAVLDPLLNACEKSNLTLAAIIMTFECGMRFLADYLSGNVYFKVQYEEHNLVRARTQFKLVKEMLALKGELDCIIDNIKEVNL